MTLRTWSHAYVLLVLAHDRPRHLRRAIESILEATGSDDVPIVVSQDGEDRRVRKTIERFDGRVDRVVHTDRPPERGDGHPSPVHGYRCIAAHYRWALDRVFEDWPTRSVIVIEDDIVVAPDALQFFDACYPVLARDPTVWAISAWNDNGQPEFVRDERRIVRSDWFPNLGVSISRGLWQELRADWPELYWDDWLRDPAIRRGRVTLRPEVSRVRHTGSTGTSFGQFFERHTGRVVLPDRASGFADLDPTTLIADAYDRRYLDRVAAATPVSIDAVEERDGDQKLIYDDVEQFRSFADRLGLMSDVRGETPRTAYRGIVECRRGEGLLFLAPGATS
ncbi:MAG: hypothetical protein MJB57_05835 [Gemmatimonadetes bacterium]|nr:hypothetical protein [Gemmatimonadota bacterium]